MARVRLDIADPANRVTLRAIIQADGHEIVDENPDVVFMDPPSDAIANDPSVPRIVLTRVGEIAQAVTAMRHGAFGYVLAPFQPGEAGITIQRALEWRDAAPGVTRRPFPEAESTPSRIEDAEARLILATLRRCKNNQTEAARILGIGRNTLWRKLRRIRQKA